MLCAGPFLTIGHGSRGNLGVGPAGAVLWCPLTCSEPCLLGTWQGHVMVARGRACLFAQVGEARAAPRRGEESV